MSRTRTQGWLCSLTSGVQTVSEYAPAILITKNAPCYRENKVYILTVKPALQAVGKKVRTGYQPDSPSFFLDYVWSADVRVEACNV